MITIGFTGTKEGLTEKQKDTLISFIACEVELNNNEIIGRHGDCIGADATFNSICEALGVSVIIHPGKNKFGQSPTRAHCGKNKKETIILEEKEYLVRDDDITKECTFLVACPKEKKEQLRSGTWTTVRRARKRNKPVVLIFNDGSINDGR